MNGFDAIIAVDWSAANTPKLGKDSIWINVKRASNELTVNLPTRALAMDFLEAEIIKTTGRVLLGFDVCFGYPAGTLKALGLQNWWQLWQLIADLSTDADDNQNNRFDVGATLNQHLGSEAGPFWGCPKSKQSEFLGMKKPKHFDFAELRTCEVDVKSAQSAWKLAYAGSVGGQSLTCIARLYPFITKMRTSRPVAVWPFEETQGSSNEVVFAEVYHSLFPIDEAEVIKDKAQVIGCCQALANAPLQDWLNESKRHAISQQEGWTLGVIRTT